MIFSIFLLFRGATLNKKVTLGAEMGEEMALRVLAAKVLQKKYSWLFSPQGCWEFNVSLFAARTASLLFLHPRMHFTPKNAEYEYEN